MASTITTSVVSGGSNSHATTAAEVQAFRTDFANPGVVGSITSTAGIAPTTGSFAVNAQGSPAMFVDVTAGTAYIKATPSGQASQMLRASMTSAYTSYAISANASGSTKFDWIYLSVDATKANNPASDASDVTSLFTSRSSSNTTDNGSPPTYGQLLAIVTVANGASSITNSNIADARTNASLVTAATNTFFFDFVESGCVWSADSAGVSLNGSMTSGVVWIGGKRLTVAAVSGHAFTASKDTYVDLTDNGDGTAAFTYTAATNNAASSALATGGVRIAIVVTGAGSIAAATSINQGQETRVLPIASSIAYSVVDSLGNLICPRDPNRKILGYRQVIANQGSITTQADVTGLSCPVIIPTGRKIKITAYAEMFDGTVDAYSLLFIMDGATVLQNASANSRSGSATETLKPEVLTTPSATSKTYKVQASGSGGTSTVAAASTSPAFILVEIA